MKTTVQEITYTYRIFYDNQLIKEFTNQINDVQPFTFLLRYQSHSVNHALKSGYKVQEINELTNVSQYWTPYF